MFLHLYVSLELYYYSKSTPIYPIKASENGAIKWPDRTIQTLIYLVFVFQANFKVQRTLLLVIGNTPIVSFVLFSSFPHALYDRHDAQISLKGVFRKLPAKMPEKEVMVVQKLPLLNCLTYNACGHFFIFFFRSPLRGSEKNYANSQNFRAYYW